MLERMNIGCVRHCLSFLSEINRVARMSIDVKSNIWFEWKDV